MFILFQLEYVSSVSVLRGRAGVEWEEDDEPPTGPLDRIGG